MKPTDWLRAKARRERKPATGGYVQADQMPVLLGGCAGPGYLVYSNPTIQVGDDEPVPVADLAFDPADPRIVIAPNRPVDPDLVPVLAKTILADPGAPPPRCPCIGIYSRCYCHLRKPTPQ